MRGRLRIFTMIAVLSVLSVGMFSLCSFAVSGSYVSLNGQCIYDASTGIETAYGVAMNISGTTRYCTASLKTLSGSIITSTGGKVGYNRSLITNYMTVNNYAHVKAHCTIYNSATPSSGAVESLSLQLK